MIIHGGLARRQVVRVAKHFARRFLAPQRARSHRCRKVPKSSATRSVVGQPHRSSSIQQHLHWRATREHQSYDTLLASVRGEVVLRMSSRMFSRSEWEYGAIVDPRVKGNWTTSVPREIFYPDRPHGFVLAWIAARGHRTARGPFLIRTLLEKNPAVPGLR